MPFVHWVVEPKFVSRKPIEDAGCGENVFESVSNNTLVGVLQQLACLVKYANLIFEDVATDLKNVHNRSKSISDRIKRLNQTVTNLDAKSISVPLGDLTKFSLLKEHYESNQPVVKEFFRTENRPLCVSTLYEKAALSPVHIIREIDRFRQDGCRSSKYFICTPVFRDDGKMHVGLDIETRRPASICEARDWQSDEELGIPQIYLDISAKNSLNNPQKSEDLKIRELRKLPSPEERTHALSLKYPYSDVPIDVTGSSFRRMASFRKSLMQQVEFFTRKKKKSKSKKNSDRRNTISGGGDIEKALEDFDSLKGTTEVKNKKRFSIAGGSGVIEHLYSSLHRPAENKGVQTGDDDGSEVVGLKSKFYVKGETSKEDVKKGSGRKSSIPISTYSQAMTLAVKLRDNGNRKKKGKGEDSGQSSSGNWSASSSTRTSVESESLRPASTTTPELVRTSSQTSVSKDSALSEGTAQTDERSNDENSYTSLKKASVKAGKSSATEHWLRGLTEEMPSEDTTDGTSTTGTLTPLLGKRDASPYDIPMAFMDDEDSSVYSVDTDGYYTSMHTDSGLRSLSSSSKPVDGAEKDGEDASTLSSVSTIDHTDSGSDGKGETGVSTEEKLKRPPPPPPPRRNSSLSPQVAQEQLTAFRPSPSPSPLSESDAEKLQEKTFINASRIPSMCIVTPNPSDDETVSNHSGSNASSGSRRAERSQTLPRSFYRNPNWSSTGGGGKFSTNSWPRSPSHLSKGVSSAESSKGPASPCLPLKYVHHITVTPGGRTFPQDPAGGAGSVVSGTDNVASTPKVIYATSSLDRRKTFPARVQAAHVTLNSQGDVIRNTQSSVSENRNHQSASVQAQRFDEVDDTNERYSAPLPFKNLTTPSYDPRISRMMNSIPDAAASASSSASLQYLPSALKYTNNTLPRAKTAGRAIPAPVFPSSQRVSFHPSVYQSAAATLPRNSGVSSIGLPKRQPSPPSPDEESSSPRSSTIDLPPPMMLMSPQIPQSNRRFISGPPSSIPTRTFQPQHSRMVPPITRPNYPMAQQGSGFNGRPQTCVPVVNPHTPAYRLVPRPHTSNSNLMKPVQNGGMSSGPPPPQRQYVLNMSGYPGREQQMMNGGPRVTNMLNGYNTLGETRVNGNHVRTQMNNGNYADVGDSPFRRSQTLPLKGSKREVNQKPMSTDDLFAAIHMSKKRLNVRSESERSASPLSCRSDSPSLLGSRMMKTPESGSLRSLGSPGDRRSWAGDEKRNTGAMDRLGPNKPTTMHDFKMLLLQAGRNNGTTQSDRQRLSASEMLRVSPVLKQPIVRGPPAPSPVSPPGLKRNMRTNAEATPSPPSTPQRSSPRPMNLSPYSRGRFRFPLHPHTDILSSPIWEDNMEDLESPEDRDVLKMTRMSLANKGMA